MSGDRVLLEAILKYLVVIDELIAEPCLPVHLVQSNRAGIDHVHDLTVDSSCSALLYLVQIQLIFSLIINY